MPNATFPTQTSLTQTSQSQPAHPGPECATDHWAEDSLFYRATLRRVVEISAAEAEKLHQQASAEAPPEKPAPDITIPLERITRIIRYTIGLARKVAERLPDAPTASGNERTKTRDHIIREVDDVILDHFKGDAARNFRDDLFCRLEQPDFEKAIGKRPIPELITELVRHLGLAGIPGPEPLKYHTDEALNEIEERARRPRPPRGPQPWPEPTVKKPSQASRSFLEKRTKKLE